MRKLTTTALTVAVLALPATPALAGHGHFVVIEATGTCQYIGHGQTSIADADHGGHHRIHDNVHTGTPGTDGRGTTFDKASNQDAYDCTARGAR